MHRCKYPWRALQACIDASIQSASDATEAVTTNGTATNGLTPANTG